MDSVDICMATSAGDHKRGVNKKNREWHSRLHLRKRITAQPPTMQSEDKHGPKKIVEEWEQSTMWPSSKKPRQEARQRQRRTNGANSLRFTCSQCSDNLEYVSKDLVRHFEENHRGIPPVFSCHMCTFTTHEFSYLQVHLLSHKDTFSSCCICKDNVQRTCSEFSAHLSTCHCQNGKYACEICKKFSTGDERVFLEHICLHSFGLEGTSEMQKKEFRLKTTTQTLRCQYCDYETSQKWSITKHVNAAHPEKKVCAFTMKPNDGTSDLDEKHFRPKTTTQTLRCQYCDYETSQKWLITKHIKAVHPQKKVCSFEMKPNDPRIKPRLTRSAVREMCWLTQDCLSLPGREFLDKYCHLSDPQTTLEETQQFLMKSVAGETGKDKWTKALQTVLSNVPTDVSLHPKAENGIVSGFSDSSRDLTVLTVQNKITVAQNGAEYAKRLKMTAEKEPESAADCENESNDLAQAETKLANDALVQNESSECTQTLENRENREVKLDQKAEGNGVTSEEPKPPREDGFSNSDAREQTAMTRALPKNMRRNQSRKRKTRSKAADSSTGLGLKIVLKKNPEKQRQWVTQSSVEQGEGSDLQSKVEEPLYPPFAERPQKKWTKASQTETEITSTPQNPDAELTADPPGPGNVERNGLEVHDNENLSQTVQGMVSDAAELGPCDSGMDRASDQEEASPVPPCSSFTSASPDPQPVITPQGETSSEDLSRAVSSDQTVKGMKDGDSSLGAFASENPPHPASSLHQQLFPKNLERTLNLVAISSKQLVKRPVGDQPVVVLNHPDADIPEVSRIMEVVHRYRGDIQKVILSQRTLNALSALDGEARTPPDPETEPGNNSVRERFVLRLKLRRISRKKYEVVGSVASPLRAASSVVTAPYRSTASPDRPPPPSGKAETSSNVENRLSCWFCGRIFTNQETWMIHRQRHLMEWKSPNCEKS